MVLLRRVYVTENLIGTKPFLLHAHSGLAHVDPARKDVGLSASARALLSSRALLWAMSSVGVTRASDKDRQLSSTQF